VIVVDVTGQVGVAWLGHIVEYPYIAGGCEEVGHVVRLNNHDPSIPPRHLDVPLLLDPYDVLLYYVSQVLSLLRSLQQK